MGTFRLDRLLDHLTGVDLLVGLVWLGLAALTVTLLLLMRTRWGQARPLRKCTVLSLLAHLLLAVYATTVHIVTSGPLEAKEPVIRVTITEDQIEPEAIVRNTVSKEKPWESFVHEPVGRPAPVELARAEPAGLRQLDRQDRPERTGLAADPSLDRLPLAEAVQPEPEALPADTPAGLTKSADKAPEPIDAPSAQQRQGVRASLPGQPQPDRPAYRDTSPSPSQRSRRAGLPSELLEQPLRMPRLTDVQKTPEPEPWLSGARDSLVQEPRGEPAEASEPQPAQGDSLVEVARAPGMDRAAAEAEHLKPPSIAMRGGVDPLDAGRVDPLESAAPAVGPPRLLPKRRDAPQAQMPAIYRLRVAPDRSKLAQLRGATPETEAAVKAALAWLADNQAPDGHWDAQTHGAGRELLVAGRNRQRAGTQADTGMTGLALLAFLASGHTHLDGPYQSNVRRGLEYLLSIQSSDGNLGGQAKTFAFMYCHAMATFALSEAYGMTGDERLREPVSRAVGYTAAAQDPSGGGWRYNPGDPGDTSQLGWQLMALKSAELAGIAFPETCRRRALKYLESASQGQYGGLASYRPGELASRPMTAEALASRQFLGMSPDDPAAGEAGNYLLGELPGQQSANLYYWYYGTLGMYYLQGTYWERWNQALQKTLLARQRKRGPLAGSWDPDTVWGGYGGRVYSTALATLCLEVYYRFLPLYLDVPVYLAVPAGD